MNDANTHICNVHCIRHDGVHVEVLWSPNSLAETRSLVVNGLVEWISMRRYGTITRVERAGEAKPLQHPVSFTGSQTPADPAIVAQSSPYLIWITLDPEEGEDDAY